MRMLLKVRAHCRGAPSGPPDIEPRSAGAGVGHHEQPPAVATT
jgi:hypothetical protein